MGRSVLIVDDEMVICQGLAVLLDWEKLGFDEVVLSYSYKDGLRKALSRRFSMILTDIILQDENGLEIVRKARELGTCRRFVLISAYAEFSFAQTAIEYGVSGYVLKPVNKEKLEKAVRDAFKPKKDLAEEEAPSAGGMGEDIVVERILQHIRVHYREKLALSALSEIYYINPSYLGQKFRKATGLKFSEYLNLYRVNRACHLLTENIPVAEICEMTGFDNISYFYRVFRKITGMKTGEFKKKKPAGEIDFPVLPCLNFIVNEN